MLAFPAALRQLVTIVVACLLLAACTPIRAVEHVELEGYWQTEGYVCRGAPAPLPVLIQHDGASLRALRRRDDACGASGEISWSGELPSGQVRKSALPFELRVVVNLQPTNEPVRLVGVASIISPDKLTIRTSDGTRYSLTRGFEPTTSDDAPSLPDASSEREDKTKTQATEQAGNGADAGPRNAGGRMADASPAGSPAKRAGSGGHAGMDQKALDRGGVGGMPAADGGAADSGGKGGAPATQRDAGMTTTPEPDAGASKDPIEPAPDAGTPTTNESRPTDRWFCIDSKDNQGVPYCNCTVDSRRHTDSCTLPKPTCCFMFRDILEQCLCYQEGSRACESFSSEGGVFAGTPVAQCPP